MDKHTYLNKRKLCSIEITDFTDYQGIGNDPMYNRFESIRGILNSSLDSAYVHFLAAPLYSPDEDKINWYIEDWQETPERIVVLNGEKRGTYEIIKKATIEAHKRMLENLHGEDLQIMINALKHIDDDFIFCADGKVFLIAWGMKPDPNKHIPKGEMIKETPYSKKCRVVFDSGEHGDLKEKVLRVLTVNEGDIIPNQNIPEVTSHSGYKFEGWKPSPFGLPINEDMTFMARYSEGYPEETPEPFPTPPLPPEPEMVTCKFNAGPNANTNGLSEFSVIRGSSLSPSQIPSVTTGKGYEFKGWSQNPLGAPIMEDTVFNAVVEKRLPWYKRFWAFLTEKGCLKWLLWLLLALLLAFLICWLIKTCKNTRGINGVEPVEKIINAAGDTIDDNGYISPITLIDGDRLPEEDWVVAPVHEEGGELPPIERNEGVPPVFSNRLFLFLEDDNASLDAFAKAFKQAYPQNGYDIIGFDRDVKSLVIQIPSDEREEIRRTINSRIPNFDFLVFDEEIYELNGHESVTSNAEPGWHLKAVNAYRGWDITKGSPSVSVAVVDDGIDPSHPIFGNRIIYPYNVYTQSNRLSVGEGHGTHTAGLAVGSLEFVNEGAAGIAPDCKLIPVQVIDNGMCPLSALVSGIMYAIHKDADVINVSIGPNFPGLNRLPEEAQEQIARSQFRNVAKLWERVCRIAERKNSIIVFAAGNDDIISSIPPENRTKAAITVGAVNPALQPSDFTNYGPGTDLSAPGVEIYSSFPGRKFVSCDGTSMAAPIVSGAIALMKSLKKDLTVEQACNALFNTGRKVNGNLPPMIQVNLALEAVKRGDFSRRPGIPGTRPADAGGTVGGVDGGGGIAVGGGAVDETERAVPISPGTAPSQGTDYDEIRRLIQFYKQKIAELEGQLPKEKK